MYNKQMQDQEGFDDNQKIELVDFDYKPITLPSQLKRKIISKPITQQGWQIARDANQGQFAQSVLMKDPQSVVYSSYLKDLISPDAQIQFEANFQNSNLQLVIRKKFLEYELFMRPDTNTNSHYQWFYFKVKCIKGGKTVNFTIKNFLKQGMLYNDGLKPFYRKKQKGNYQQIPGTIKYYQNPLQYSYCLNFTFQFVQEGQQVQFCSQPPYTYTKLFDFLSQKKIQWKTLCKSYLGKKVPYLIFNQSKCPKGYAICIARQHPGQSVGSWMMEGVIQKLIKNNSSGIQWIVVPMICIDGVILGNNRTGLSGFDYNRFWNSQQLNRREKNFPQIISFLNLVKILKRLHPKKPKLFFDLHGHSSQPNIFTYGPPHQTNSENYLLSRAFPQILSQKNQNFSLQQCSYTIKPDKKNTARSFLFYQMLFPFVYTIQASFGIMRNKQVNQKQFLQFGEDLVDASHQFLISCVLAQKPTEASAIFDAIKARGQQNEGQQFDSDSERDRSVDRRQLVATERSSKPQKQRLLTDGPQYLHHKGHQQHSFQLFKVQQNVVNRYPKPLQKKRNHTDVGHIRVPKTNFLPKLKQSMCAKGRPSSVLKQQQVACEGSLMNIKQIQKRLFRLRNSRIGKKILIINAYGV